MELITAYNLSKKYPSAFLAGQDLSKVEHTGLYTESFPVTELLIGNVEIIDKPQFIESVYEKMDLTDKDYCMLGKKLKAFARGGTLKVYLYAPSHMVLEMKDITERFSITHREDGAYLSYNDSAPIRRGLILHVNYESYVVDKPEEESKLPW